MSLSPRVEVKVGPLFDILEGAMAEGNIDLAKTMINRISIYFHLLDDEHVDYYQACQHAIEDDTVHYFLKEDDYNEPTEYDEWQDFDQGC